MEAQAPQTFIDYAKAFGPFLAAIVAVGVGVMQYYLQRQRFKLDLYDKRFHVYEAAGEYMVALVATQGKVDDDDLGKFRRNTDPGQFMFGSDVWGFLVELRKTGVAFESLRRQHEDYVAAAAFSADPNRFADLVGLYCVEAIDVSDPNELERRHKNVLAEMPILQRQIQDKFMQTCRMSERKEEVFRPYLQLHYDRSWPIRAIRQIDRFVNSDAPSKLASRYDR
jgi:hypothetical protein